MLPSSLSIWAARDGTDFPQPRAALADDDALLAVPLDVEDRVHVDQVVALLPRIDLVDHHRQRVRQLVANSFEGRLTDELGHQDFLGLVGQLAVGVVRRADGQRRGQHIDQHVDLCAGYRRHRNDLGRIADQLADRDQLRGHPVFRHLVDLGDDADAVSSWVRSRESDRRSTGRPGRSPRRPGCTARSRPPRCRCRGPSR